MNPAPPLPDDERTAPRPNELRAALYRFRVPIVAALGLSSMRVLTETLGGWNALAVTGLTGFAIAFILGAAKLMRASGGASWRVRFGMRHLMLMVVVAAVLLQLTRALGMALPILIGISLPPILAVAIYVTILGRRTPEQDGLVAVLSLAADRGAELGPAAAAYAGLCSERYGRRIRRFAERLDAGGTLPEALDAVPHVVPPAASALARVGWHAGTLAPALREAVASQQARRDTPSVRRLIGYPLAVLGCVLIAWMFYSYFILPKFRAILQDFGAQSRSVFDLGPILPASVRWVWALPGALVQWLSGAGELPELDGEGGWVGLILTLSLGLGALIIAVLLAAWLLVRVLRLVGSGLGPMFGRTALPARLAPLDLRRDGATILRALAVGVLGGRPLPEVLRAIPARDLGALGRRRLAAVRADVAAGQSWVESLGARGLIRPVDGAVLEAAGRAGNLTWALSERADAMERRENLRLRAWGQVLQPLAIAALGLLVLAFALGYFLPLVRMIESMAEDFA